MSLRETLDALDKHLSTKLSLVTTEAQASQEDLDAVKQLRIAIQRKVEELERAHNLAVQNASRIATEYERLAALRERAANAMALSPPTSPVAPRRAIKAIKDTPRLLEELSAAAVPMQAMKNLCGVYFLMQDKEVVYVGQSVGIMYRVVQHATEGTKKFNSWCYVEVRRNQLDEVERFYITLLRPKYNKAGKPVLLAENDPTLHREAA